MPQRHWGALSASNWRTYRPVFARTLGNRCCDGQVCKVSFRMRYAAGYRELWNMMTSWNGNIFRATGHLCGEFIGPRWIPRTKASDAELWCFLWSASDKRLSKQSWGGLWFETPLRPLWHHRNDWGISTHIKCVSLRIYINVESLCTQLSIKLSISISVWPIEAIWRHWSGTTRAELMACCPMTRSHYMNQYQLIIIYVLWYLSEKKFARNAWDLNPQNEFENRKIKITANE